MSAARAARQATAEATEPAPAPSVGGQRDGCREPGACRADGPDLCRQCAAQTMTTEAA